MFVIKSKHSGEYLKRIYRSELGAKRSITCGLLKENAHLLENYEIVPVILNIK